MVTLSVKLPFPLLASRISVSCEHSEKSWTEEREGMEWAASLGRGQLEKG